MNRTTKIVAHLKSCTQCKTQQNASLPEQRFWIDPATMCPVGGVLYKAWWEWCYCRPYPATLEAAIETPAPME